MWFWIRPGHVWSLGYTQPAHVRPINIQKSKHKQINFKFKYLIFILIVADAFILLLFMILLLLLLDGFVTTLCSLCAGIQSLSTGKGCLQQEYAFIY